MPTPTKGPRLGAGPAHERALLAGLATQLFEHRSITTTEAKAKRLRPFAERLVTFAKRGDLAARRRVLSSVRDKGVVHELFTEIAPALAERAGGYTRITKIGPRKGDNAPMAVIELVLEPLTARASTVREAEAATARSARGNRSAGATAASAAPAGEPGVVTSGGASVDEEVGRGAAADATSGGGAPAAAADEAATEAPLGATDAAEATGTDTPDAPGATGAVTGPGEATAPESTTE